MSQKFLDFLEKKSVLLADGATGTNLFNMGLESGEAPEFWNIESPDKIRALYQGAIDAGSDLFLTNSFGGNASRLALHNGQNRVRELNLAAAKLAREVADQADRPIIVAGSVGPTGDIFQPVGSLSHEDGVALFQEQAQALMDGGVDILWVETISAPEEYRAAAEAFANIGAPWAGTMSFDTAGRTMMGITPAKMVELVASIENKPLAFGANCGVGASDLLRTVTGFVKALKERDLDIAVIAKGNAGIPKYVDGHIHYDGTPELMADYAVMARDIGANIIGGCCGTMPEHLRAMREAINTRPKAEAPSFEAIQARLGGFSSEDDGSAGAPEPAPRRRRRRG